MFSLLSFPKVTLRYQLSGSGGHYDKCIVKFEEFDEYARSYINNSGLKERNYDLQEKLVNITGSLELIQVYTPSVAKNSITLDAQLHRLCDDDDSNDAEATANINACLQSFLCVKEVNGKKYVVYDQQKIQDTLKYVEKDGLACQLLSSVNAQIEANKRKGVSVPDAITELGVGGKLENTKLEVRKDCAGVRLEITSNTDWIPLNEINHKPVAYAVTEESAMNYFMNGESYDWDAIEAWYKAGDDFNDNYHYNSIEYDVLSFEMNNMSDAEISQLINSAVYWKDPACIVNVVSEKLDILSDRHMLQMQELRVMGSDAQKEILGCTGKDFENKYTRAVLIRTINNRLQALPPTNTYYVDISCERSKFAQQEYDENVPTDTLGDRDYTANIHTITPPLFPNPAEIAMGVQTITVHPYSGYAEIQGNINAEVCVTVNGMATTAPKEMKSFVVNQTIGYLTGKINTATYFGYAMSDEMIALADAYESEAKAKGVNEALNQASAAQSMMVEGTTVHISGAGAESIYIFETAFDDKQLLMNVAAYNEQHETHYTIEQMKREYADNSKVFNQYNNWYTRYGLKETDNLKIELGEEYGQEKYEAMSAEELESALKEKGLF